MRETTLTALNTLHTSLLILFSLTFTLSLITNFVWIKHSRNKTLIFHSFSVYADTLTNTNMCTRFKTYFQRIWNWPRRKVEIHTKSIDFFRVFHQLYSLLLYQSKNDTNQLSFFSSCSKNEQHSSLSIHWLHSFFLFVPFHFMTLLYSFSPLFWSLLSPYPILGIFGIAGRWVMKQEKEETRNNTREKRERERELHLMLFRMFHRSKNENWTKYKWREKVGHREVLCSVGME